MGSVCMCLLNVMCCGAAVLVHFVLTRGIVVGVHICTLDAIWLQMDSQIFFRIFQQYFISIIA